MAEMFVQIHKEGRKSFLKYQSVYILARDYALISRTIIILVVANESISGFQKLFKRFVTKNYFLQHCAIKRSLPVLLMH